jgi:kinesin family member 2/24
MAKNKIDPKRKKQHISSLGMNIYVCVRKRPLFEKEVKDGQIDCVSSANPIIRVGEPRFKVDGITKFIENNDHTFDNVFGDNSSTEELYQHSI